MLFILKRIWINNGYFHTSDHSYKVLISILIAVNKLVE